MYDAIIIGGGPAGLSAAVYLGRFTRTVLVLDSGVGRSSFSQKNENYLGFPDGVTIRELRHLGQRQAMRFGAEFKECCVERVEKTANGFKAHTTEGDFESKTLLFATGVTDIWPNIMGIESYIGKQVFWCITCDGWRSRNQEIICIGNTDEAATTTLQFLLFTDRITLVADPRLERISTGKKTALAEKNIALVYGVPQNFELDDTAKTITSLCLDTGVSVPCSMLFALLGVRPNTQMAREIGIGLDEQGYIRMDDEGYTNIPGVFAAGDLTRLYTQQVASAVHAGAEAAQTMNYYLYAPFQRNKGDEKTADLYLDCPDERLPLMQAAQ